jgi:hypothetical protein
MTSPDTKFRRYVSKCLVAVIICVIPAASACTKRRQVVTVPPPPPAPVIARVSAPVPLYSPVPASLPDFVYPPLPGDVEREHADRAFIAGSYDEAILSYESALLLAPSGERRDEALFRLGICYVLRNNSSSSDWQRARTTLQQLINDYPNSSLKPPALVILTLRTRADELSGNIKAREQAMKQLSIELEKLKQIDAERGRFLTP